jgi:hypothetical protein
MFYKLFSYLNWRYALLKTTPFAMFVFTLALVCQLLMPFTQSLAALIMDSQSIVFCTPLGLTTVSVNADT